MIVEIYGMEGCSFCDKAVELAEVYSLPYFYKQLDKDYQIEEYMLKFKGASTFPQIMINGIPIGGYSDFEEVMEMASE